MATKREFIRAALVVLVVGSLLGSAGCGYLKNVRDDFQDILILGAGVTPPTTPVKGEDGGDAVAGIFPPSLGVYVEATEFMHLGGIIKGSGDVEWDRRGLSVGTDCRAKIGLGPAHYVRIYQDPVAANAYKREGNELDGWREHMRDMRDHVYDRPAKELIFADNKNKLPFMHRGWQDWEVFAAEVAIPEPFILHSGFNVRAGVNPCEVFDFALSLFCIDLYNDRAYEYASGNPRFPVEAQAKAGGEKKAGYIDRVMLEE